MTYVDGYVYGQHDALTWLTVPGDDDRPLAAFDERVQMRAALVCLARNLRDAAALERAFGLGRDDRVRAMLGLPAGEDWRSGCGREAP